MSKVKDQNVIKNIKTGDEPAFIRAMLDTGSFNSENNTVDVTWATETPVIRVDIETGERFYEVLSFDPDHADLTRLNANGPVLNNHKKTGRVEKAQVGVVQRAFIADKQGRANLRLSKEKKDARLVGKVKDGIICNISCGYRVFWYRDITQPGDAIRTLLAIKWQGTEISFTTVPADYTAGVRSLREMGVSALSASVEPPVVEDPPPVVDDIVEDPPPVAEQVIETNLNNKRSEMEETPEQKVAREKLEKDNERKAVLELERTRATEVNDCVRDAGLEPAFAIEHITKGTDINEVRRLAIAEVAKKQTNHILGVGFGAAGNDNEAEGNRIGLEEALSIRAFGVTEAPKTDYGKASTLRRVTLMEHARHAVQIVHGGSVSLLSDNDVLKRAMTTTDYPLALANVMNKNLRSRYQAVEPVWKRFAIKETASDFKDIYSVTVDGNFIPEELLEEDEYTYDSLVESGDKYRLRQYGRGLKLSRMMIINDDLKAFTQMAPKFANGVIQKQADLVYALLNGNGRVLGADNKSLFHADHNNLASGALKGPIADATLEAAQTAMLTQKGPAGERITVTPKFLLVPPQLKVLAQKWLNGTINATEVANINVWKGAFELLVEQYLSDSPTAWYLISDPGQLESIKWAELAGEEGIYTDQMWDFDTDTLKMKIRNTFACTVEEHRGIYKNPGQ